MLNRHLFVTNKWQYTTLVQHSAVHRRIKYIVYKPEMASGGDAADLAMSMFGSFVVGRARRPLLHGPSFFLI